MTDFKSGDIVKFKHRSSARPLFLMVIEDPERKSEFAESFSAVVLLDLIDTREPIDPPGTICHNWLRINFSLSSWDDFRSFI